MTRDEQILPSTLCITKKIKQELLRRVEPGNKVTEKVNQYGEILNTHGLKTMTQPI